MNKKISTLILLSIISVIAISCSFTGASQNENLPEGMVSGVWLTEDGARREAFVFFNDGFFSDFHGHGGQYSLIDENTISITAYGFDEDFVVNKIEKPNERVMINYATYYLAVEDDSSESLEKDIVGTWAIYDSHDFWENTEPMGEMTFERNGTGSMFRDDTEESVVDDFSYEVLIENEILFTDIQLPLMTAHSLGNVLFLDSRGVTVVILVKQ